MICKNCNHVNSDDSKFCSECGQSFVKVEKSPKKKWVWVSVISFIILAVAGIGAGFYMVKEKEEAKEEQINTYVQQMTKTAIAIFDEVTENTSVLSLYSNQWSNAIDSGQDFNIALLDAQLDLQKDRTLPNLEQGQTNIRQQMESLQSPPEGYEDTYKVLKELYGIYTELASQAQSPSGSLVSFNTNVDTTQSEFNRVFEEFLITAPKDVRNAYYHHSSKDSTQLKDNIVFDQLMIKKAEENWELNITNNNSSTVFGHLNVYIYDEESNLLIYEVVTFPKKGLAPSESFTYKGDIEQSLKKQVYRYEISVGSLTTEK